MDKKNKHPSGRDSGVASERKVFAGIASGPVALLQSSFRNIRNAIFFMSSRLGMTKFSCWIWTKSVKRLSTAFGKVNLFEKFNASTSAFSFGDAFQTYLSSRSGGMESFAS